jgi:hypothetical protein
VKLLNSFFFTHQKLPPWPLIISLISFRFWFPMHGVILIWSLTPLYIMQRGVKTKLWVARVFRDVSRRYWIGYWSSPICDLLHDCSFKHLGVSISFFLLDSALHHADFSKNHWFDYILQIRLSAASCSSKM